MSPDQYVQLLIKDVKKFHKKYIPTGSKTYNSGKPDEQLAFEYQVFFYDLRRQTEIFFMIRFLVANNNILRTTIRDEKGREIEFLTDRVVERYLLSKADRSLERNIRYLYKV